MTLAQIAQPVGIILIWWLLVHTDTLDPFTWSSPSRVWNQLSKWTSNGDIWTHTWSTLKVLLVGYVAGVVVGSLIGIASALSAVLRACLNPFLIVGNAIPKIILVPFLIAAFGFGPLPGVILVFGSVVVLVTFVVDAGIKELKGAIVTSARVLGAGTFALLRDVYLPGLSLWIVSSARLTLGIALQAALVADFYGSSSGLGFFIVHGQQTLVAGEIYAAIVIVIVLALIIDYPLGLLEARQSKWLPTAGRN
jgi:NitT/TauT family transport system permease protein